MAENIDVNVNVNTQQAVKQIDNLTTAVKGLLAIVTGREMIQFADSITNVRNRLLTLTPDLQKVDAQFKAIASIAINARTPLEATGDLFFRIARSADQLGISTKEAAQITDSLAKAMSASGLSAQEAGGPLLQLGQALQSGVFQGDELRSIMEGLPPVAKALADELGVPIGQLKKLGSEGQISADIFVKAMRRAKDSIDEAFGRTTPTITQSIEQLKSVSKVLFDEFERNTDTGKNLAISIKLIAAYMLDFVESIDKIIGPLKMLVSIGVSLLAFSIIGKIFNGIKAIFVGMAAAATTTTQAVTGLTRTFEIIGYRIGKFLEAGEFTRKTLDAITKSLKYLGIDLGKLAGVFAQVGAAIYSFFAIEDIAKFFKKTEDGSSGAAKKLQEFDEKLKGMREGLDDAAPPSQNLIALQNELAKAAARSRLEMETAIGNLQRSLDQTKERLILENAIISANVKGFTISEDTATLMREMQSIDMDRINAISTINDQIKKLNLEYSQLNVKDSQRGKEIQQQVGILKQQVDKTNQQYKAHAEGMTNLLRESNSLKMLDEDRLRTQQNIIKAIEEQINRQNSLAGILQSANEKAMEPFKKLTPDQLVGLNSLQKQILEIEQSTKLAAEAAAKDFAKAFEQLGDELTPEQAQEFANGLDQIAEAYGRVAQAQIEVATKNATITRSFTYGWKEAYASYIDDATNAAKMASNAFTSITNNMNSAIDNFVKTGKLNFKDFAKSVIQDLIAIELKSQATKIFSAGSSMLGNFLGSLFGGAFAEGGNPPINKPSLVGEKGPELFVPKSAGTIVPNSGLQDMAPVTNNYITNNINALDAKSVAQLFAENRKTLLGTVELARKEMPYNNR